KAQSDGDARAVVQRKETFERAPAGGSEGVEERRPLRLRHAGDLRHDPVAVSEHVVSDPERRRVIGLPWVMSDKTEQDPRRAQKYEAGLLERTVRAGWREI